MGSKAATEAMAGISSMSTTMMPFLYQTRTLSTLPWIRTNSNFLPRYRTAARTTACFTRTYGNFSESGRFSRETRKNRPTKNTPRWDDIAFEGEETPMPSVYPERRGTVVKNRSHKKLNEFGESDDGIFGEPDLSEEEEYDIFADETDSKQQVPKSTITDRERRAFQNIFSEMFAQKPGSMDPNDPSNAREQAKTKLDVIMAGAMVATARSRKEKEAVINQYPPALRDSISKAIGLHDEIVAKEGGKGYEQDPEDADGGEVTGNIEIEHAHLEALREPERIRVETLMKEANTDFELWEVMEKEVFSLIPRLGLDKPTSLESMVDGLGKSNRGKKKLEPIPKNEDEGAARFKQMVEETTDGSEAAALNTYGPLYPSYLLLAIRLFDRSFAKPSPLALSILPKIKSLGDTSTVLGASTQFYNEILRISLLRYENIAGMLTTLTEMEKWAVEFDEETLDIISEASSLAGRARAGNDGAVIKHIWSRMPQFASRGIKEWREKIVSSLSASERSS
ncbi:hypothetical protein HYALB_00005378 [Hymenoscyphus albidus]|uniref:Mtf2-like C-terminal domain-containing protein n=1 Tax=Hymenoscyphus albidus TaxID=595503 RepID=A0A9N9LHU1_9HELO|nr:hypothetical protein HYALB_00005378 [Hymenoscyphus albidus]